MKKKIAIIGAGELGLQIANLVEQDNNYEVCSFYDDFITIGTKINKYKVDGTIDDIYSSFMSKKFNCLLLGIGYKHLDIRQKLYEKFSEQIPFATIIHPTCFIDPTAKIGNGSVLYPGCIVDKNAIIENNVLLNLGVVISHNSYIASHSFISPRVVIAGFSSIGECCNIGINTTIIDNIKITNNVFTGGGSVIIKNIELSGLYVGNPARFIR